jgi:hypothetical protein
MWRNKIMANQWEDKILATKWGDKILTYKRGDNVITNMWGDEIQTNQWEDKALVHNWGEPNKVPTIGGTVPIHLQVGGSDLLLRPKLVRTMRPRRLLLRPRFL